MSRVWYRDGIWFFSGAMPMIFTGPLFPSPHSSPCLSLALLTFTLCSSLQLFRPPLGLLSSHPLIRLIPTIDLSSFDCL